MNLYENIEKIKRLMSNTLADISSLDTDQFNERLNSAINNMQLVNKIKAELKKNYSVEDLRKHESELVILSEKINGKYSAVIEEFVRQKEYIACEISRTSNRKRLELYKR